MTQAQINDNLLKVAAGKRKHAYYDRTVELAKKYMALSTGSGIEHYMKLYSRREDKALFKTRCEITQQITPSIIANLSAVLEKAYRSFYRREVNYGDDNKGESEETKTAEFESFIARYAGRVGVDRYLQDRLIELNCTDPNTWIIQEWKDFDNLVEYADPYPFEASSEMAVDFVFDRAELQYLTVLSSIPNAANPGKPLKKYTCYQKNFACTLRQTGRTNVGVSAKDIPFGQSGVPVMIEGDEYIYDEYYHDLGEVKAMRAGYKRDKQTAGQSFVWPFDAADPYLMKSLKVVSELDLTSANVAMPLTVRYGDECGAPKCENGYVEGSVCKICNGTGHKQSPTSVMEEIVVKPMPSSPDDMIDLSRLFVHIHPDVSILDWQEKYVDTLERKCKSAVLNSEIFNKKEVADTATGKSIDQQNANDFVYKYFRFYAEFWQFTVYAIADITGKRAGLTASIVVSKDLKLKTVEELMDDLKRANESGAGPATRQSIEWDIMRALTSDNPEEFMEWQVKEEFNPFSGFTEEQKMVWSQSPLVPIEQRVLYANLGYIFDQLESENPNFYRLPHADQKAAVGVKVAEIVARVQVSGPQIEG